MKFTSKDFGEEALNQGELLQLYGYVIKWSTCCGLGFIKLCKANTPMTEDIRFNIKTGRQIIANEFRRDIDQNTLDTIVNTIRFVKYNKGNTSCSLYESAAMQINKINKGREGWEDINIEKLPTKFILAPKKKG